MLKKISTLHGTQILSKNEQKSIHGGGGSSCPGAVCKPNYVCCEATHFQCRPITETACP